MIDPPPAPRDGAPEALMSGGVEAAWRRLTASLAPAAAADLRPGCDEADLAAAERRLGFPLPAPLRALYRLADGQAGAAPGLFPGNCRWSPRAQRVAWHPEGTGLPPCRLLPLEAACATHARLRDDAAIDVFEPSLVPFAANGEWTVLCLDRATGAVQLLWTGGPDWTLPQDWQTLRHTIAAGLEDLLAASAR